MSPFWYWKKEHLFRRMSGLLDVQSPISSFKRVWSQNEWTELVECPKTSPAIFTCKISSGTISSLHEVEYSLPLRYLPSPLPSHRLPTSSPKSKPTALSSNCTESNHIDFPIHLISYSSTEHHLIQDDYSFPASRMENQVQIPLPGQESPHFAGDYSSFQSLADLDRE